jgi:hypothetical protein
MDDSEIKIKLFKQIDTLNNERLVELFGIVSNFINSTDNPDEWDNLTKIQRKGLKYGLAELDEGKGLEHSVVMEELKKKYGIS